MKKTIKILSLATLLIALGTTSCKKYDEGGKHWRTKAKITDKVWKLDYTSDNDTSFAIMDRWETMQFEKNGDWVVNGDKWGTHNFYKDAEHSDQKNSLWVYVDSSATYWDSLAILNKSIRNSNTITLKEYAPVITIRFDIIQLKKKTLGIKTPLEQTTHKAYYNAN